MTTLVTDNLPLVSGALGGIAKLRDLILELAIRGKLTEREPTDEPVSELLAKIESARISSARSKRASAVSDAAPPPFEIPRGWAWIRLGDLLSKIGAGSTPLGGKQAYVDVGVKFLRSQNVWNEGLHLDDVALISAETHARMSGTHVQPGDILFNITGASIGRCALVPDSFDTGNVSQHVTIIRPWLGSTRRYLHAALKSKLVQDTVMAVQVGVSREGLSIGKLAQFYVPLPPIAEQDRIVARVDQLMALCDRLEAEQADAEAAHAKLVEALLGSLTQARDAADFRASWQQLSEHFHTLFTTEASVDALEQTVLQLGVGGKLVPQCQGNESATDLLSGLGIKSLAHELPGWASVPLGNLGIVLGGATPSKANAAYWTGDIPWVSPKDMKRAFIADSEDHVSPEAIAGSALKLIPEGSILMVVRGMILAHSFPVALTETLVTINQDMKALVPPAELARYLLLILQAPKQDIVALVDRSSHGTCKLVSEKLWSHTVAVPPLAEQARIVAKVDELLSLCDQLKANLVRAQQHHVCLASVLVEQAVA